MINDWETIEAQSIVDENAKLREENEQLKKENYELKEAMKRMMSDMMGGY